MNTARKPFAAAAVSFAAALLAAACAGLPAAQMTLPEGLNAAAPERITGLKAARSGEFDLSGRKGRFERSADRLSLFGDSLAWDRIGASYTLAGATPISASCKARQTTASVGVLSGAPRPYEVQCDYSGGFSGRLTLAAPGVSAAGREERSGRIEAAGQVLELRSVHRVQGSPLPLQAPIGYVFSQQGKAVGAVELNGTPRLWRPAEGTPLREAVTQAALALALLWDPAGR